MLNLPGLKKVRIPLAGGLDEVAASDDMAPEDAITMLNFRLSKDGKRIEKRLGLDEEVTDFAVDVYGYNTYFNSGGSFCKIAVLETGIYNKVGAGAWSSVYGMTVSHPVHALEIQGKQLVITEGGSRMIHYNGSSYQIGIDAPETIPTPTPQYTSETVTCLDDDMAYADQAAMDAVWTDDDSGATVASTLDTEHMKFTQSGLDPIPVTDYAQRYLAFSDTPSSKYTLEFDLNVTHLQSSNTYAFRVTVYNGSYVLPIIFSATACTFLNYLNAGSGAGVGPTAGVTQRWKFIVDTSVVSAATIRTFVDDVEYTPITIRLATTADDKIYIKLPGMDALPLGGSYSNVWIDNILVTQTELALSPVVGTNMYAVTYVRGGNYGCESNPIKSVIGSPAFVGSGVDNLTVSGTYANTESVSLRVQIDTDTPDIVKWSTDGGTSWDASVAMSTTMYLPYGIVLTWAAVTGHVAGDYWDITCTVCSAAPLNQQVELTSIPISADPQVTARKIYRTTSGGASFYYLATINDNTTTSFIDNLPDTALGALMEEDHDVCPDGMFSCYWDDRLWVFDHTENLAYYSQVGTLEHFDIANRWVAIKRGTPGDEITGVVPYKDAIYVFLPNTIFAIQKTQIAYGVYQMNNDVGCISPWTLCEVNDYLMFRSYRGIEVYDGTATYQFDFSLAVHETLGGIDNTYNELACSAHDKEYNEVWFSFPDLNKTVVWNYLKNKWYVFTFYKTPSILSVCRNSLKKNVLMMGTQDGYVCLCDSGYLDGATAISATYRKGWLDLIRHGVLKRIDVEYELNTGSTLTMNLYVDMDQTVFRTFALTGVTPGATNTNQRRPVYEKIEVGGRGKWYSIEFTNAQDTGLSNLKVNDCYVFVREDVHKNKSYAND